MSIDDALVMILAGGEGKRLLPLTKDRAKPAVPFGGRYRIIDFVLNNFINSGFFSDETADFAQHYLQSEQSIANFNGILRLCLDYIPRFLIFIFLIKEYILQRIQ